MSLAFTISDLRQCPEFFDTVASRIWQAWWEAEGASFDYISGRLRENMNEVPIPLALVAHDGFLRKVGLDPAGNDRSGATASTYFSATPAPASFNSPP
jgi:hypothetical protein